jgi:lipopolysaccharide transport system ATP-binding protein
MSSGITISVKNLTKTYRLYNSPLDRLKESLHPFGKKFHHDYYAINDVNLEVRRGETVGIIGKNGSGKSTLLKMIAGVLTPTTGCLAVQGRISALLELGAGFNPELTGVENVCFNGMLMGYTREEMVDRLDDILAFADIGEFAYQPVKIYSSGMFVRLAFAISVSVNPEILIIDEALSVGDANFQQKCMTKMNEFKESGCSILFVSHDVNAVKLICDRAYLVNNGSIVDDGVPENVVHSYNYLLAKERQNEVALVTTDLGYAGFGNRRIEVIKIELLNSRGEPAKAFMSGDQVTVRVSLHAREEVDDVVVGISLRDRFGQDIFGINTCLMNKAIAMKAGGTLVCEFSFALNIGLGSYSLSVATHRGETHIDECYFWCESALDFQVNAIAGYPFTGVARLYVDLDVKGTDFKVSDR